MDNYPVSYAPMLNLYHHQVNEPSSTEMVARSESFRDAVEGRYVGVRDIAARGVPVTNSLLAC